MCYTFRSGGRADLSSGSGQYEGPVKPCQVEIRDFFDKEQSEVKVKGKEVGNALPFYLFVIVLFVVCVLMLLVAWAATEGLGWAARPEKIMNSTS